MRPLMPLASLVIVVALAHAAALPAGAPALNWTLVAPEGGNATNGTAKQMDVFYGANCTSIYLLLASGGKPLAGAEVQLYKYPKSAGIMLANGTSDANGIFAFRSTDANADLSASAGGYAPAEMAVPLDWHPCRQLSVSFGYDCATENATVQVAYENTPVENASVTISPMGARGRTDAAGKFVFKAYESPMIFVRVSDADSIQTAAFETQECPKQPEAPKVNATPAPSRQPGPGEVTISPQSPAAPEKKDSGLDPVPIGLAVALIAAVAAILWHVMAKEAKGIPEGGKDEGEESPEGKNRE